MQDKRLRSQLMSDVGKQSSESPLPMLYPHTRYTNMLTFTVNMLLFISLNVYHGLNVSLFCQYANTLISPEDKVQLRLLGMTFDLQVFGHE